MRRPKKNLFCVGMKTVEQDVCRNNIKQLQSLSINTEQVIRRVNLILISWHGTDTEIYLYTTHYHTNYQPYCL